MTTSGNPSASGREAPAGPMGGEGPAASAERLSESRVIQAARHAADAFPPGPEVLAGIGDDAAILWTRPDESLLVSQDMLMEDIHFRTDWTEPEWLGAKSVAVNVSDIAAMGGQPFALLTAVALPARVSLDWVQRFYGGVAQAASRHGAALVGGDTVGSPDRIVVDITVLGQAATPRRRVGALIGDLVVVTGHLGLAHAGWKLLERGRRLNGSETPDEREALHRHLLPQAQVAAGKILARVAHSLTDISDGLVAEVRELTPSGLGALVDLWTLPVRPSTRRLSREAGESPILWALYGAEDYELLATLPPEAFAALESELARAGVTLTAVGHIVADSGLWGRETPDGDREPLAGAPSFDHFGSGASSSGSRFHG